MFLSCDSTNLYIQKIIRRSKFILTLQKPPTFINETYSWIVLYCVRAVSILLMLQIIHGYTCFVYNMLLLLLKTFHLWTACLPLCMSFTKVYFPDLSAIYRGDF